MIQRLILFFLFSLTSIICFGQNLNEYYVSITIDSTEGGRLKFLSDSTVELGNIPRHMWPYFKSIHKYTSTDSTIEIDAESLTKEGVNYQIQYMQSLFTKTKISLTKIDGGFIDSNKSIIYVKQEFGKNPDMTYIIDNKMFIQKMGVSDGYGSFIKSPKKNRALEKKIRSIDINNCQVEIAKGLNAYKRFGIKAAYGAIVITSKQ